jgi:spermidine synthase
MTLRLLIIGFVSILGQVVLLRELAVALYGIELTYVLGIGAWLLGTGLGAAARAKSFVPRPAHVSLLLLAFSILLPLDVVFIRAMRHVFGGVSGAYLPIPQQLFGIAVTLIPVGIVLGLLFQWSARLYLTGARTMAAAYAVESAGGVLGGLLSTLTLKWGIANAGAALLCSVIALIPLMTFGARQRGERAFRILALTLTALCALAYAKAPGLDRLMTGWNHAYLTLTRDTPYGRVTVTRLDHQISVYENDVLSFETEGTSAEEIVHLAMLSHPRPREVLILGGGLEGMAFHVLQHDPARVDYVELNGPMLRAVEPLLPADQRQSLTDSRVRVIEGDPRRELARLPSYDVIVVAMPEPVSGQANRFYTREFFERVAAHLHPGGVLAFRLRSSENFWPQPLILRNGGIVRAVRSVFGSVLILPGTSHLVVASMSALPADPDTLAKRFTARGIQARLVQPSYIRYLYTNDRRAQIESQFAHAAAPMNTDERPICYHFAATVWLSKFYPRLLRSGSLLGQSWDPWKVVAIFALLCGAVIAITRLPARRKAELLVLMGVAGCCGMVLETVLLLRFQSERGVLYQDIGVLLTLFMLGLAAGAGAVAGLTKSFTHGALRVARMSRVTLLGFAVLSLLIAWRVSAGGMAGMLGSGAALFACGAMVAAVFGLAGLAAGSDGPGVGALYSADLAGGCVGSLVASLWLIPLAGLILSAAICGLICVAALVLIRR